MAGINEREKNGSKTEDKGGRRYRGEIFYKK
jgi:hypothetical protein